MTFRAPGRGTPRAAWASCLPALALLAPALATPARAEHVSFRARTVYHAYRVRLSDDRSVDLFRDLNRFYQSLDAAAFSLGGEGGVDVILSLRYDTDLGTGFRRDTPEGRGVPAVDGRDALDLLYAYVDWRNIVEGRLDLRAGRQLLLDDLDWYSLDGVKLTLHPFRGAMLEAYVGRPVFFDVFLSSEALIGDGIEHDDRAGLGGLAFGGAAYFRFFGDLSLSAAYRQELAFRGDDVVPFGVDPASPEGLAIRSASAGKTGLQESLIGASAGYTVRAIDLSLHGHLTWNLLFGEIDQARAGAAYDPHPALHAGVELLRVRPRFAGDAIWNVFNIFPYDRFRTELDAEIVHGLRAELGYFVQKFHGGPKGPRSADTPGGAGLELKSSDVAHGPSGGLSYRPGRFGAGAYAEASTNLDGSYAYGGNFRRFELFFDASMLEERLLGVLRLGYTGFQNDWFEEADRGQVDVERASATIDLGVRASITDHVQARVSFVKNISSVFEGGYRVFSELEVRY